MNAACQFQSYNIFSFQMERVTEWFNSHSCFWSSSQSSSANEVDHVACKSSSSSHSVSTSYKSGAQMHLASFLNVDTVENDVEVSRKDRPCSSICFGLDSISEMDVFAPYAYCLLCHTSLPSEATLAAHLFEQSHCAHLWNLMKLPENVTDGSCSIGALLQFQVMMSIRQIADSVRNEWNYHKQACTTCGVFLETEPDLGEHFQSQSHKEMSRFLTHLCQNFADMFDHGRKLAKNKLKSRILGADDNNNSDASLSEECSQSCDDSLGF